MRILHRLICVYLLTSIVASCGGGGGSSNSDPLPERLVISADPAGDITVSNFDDCNGPSWEECVKITASISKVGNPRIDSYGWILDSATGGDYCGGATTSNNGYTLTVPAYCNDSGYQCRFSFNVDGTDSNTTFRVFDQYITYVTYNPLSCGKPSGTVFNGERLKGATVFVDANYNFKLDENEIRTKSNFFGDFVLPDQIYPNQLVGLGGVGIDTNTDHADSILIGTSVNAKPVWLSPMSSVQSVSADFNSTVFSLGISAPEGYEVTPEYKAFNEGLNEVIEQIRDAQPEVKVPNIFEQVAEQKFGIRK